MESFRQRIADDIVARPDFYFIRYEVVYTKKRMEWAAQELATKLQMFAEWVDGKGVTYRNQAACTGKWNCAYLSACASDSMAGFERDAEFTYHELED